MQREMGGHIMAVSGQRLGKHVPAGTDTNATMVQQQRNGVFCCPRRDIISRGQG
jgi:hypothetical protein